MGSESHSPPNCQTFCRMVVNAHLFPGLWTNDASKLISNSGGG